MSKVFGRAIAVSTLVLALYAAMMTTTGATAFADEWNSCDLRVKVNELRGLDANNQYNIIVYKASAEKSINLNGVRINGHKRAEACNLGGESIYYWAMFKSGTFVHQGDGGYLNWAFYGSFKRVGNNVTFYAH